MGREVRDSRSVRLRGATTEAIMEVTVEIIMETTAAMTNQTHLNRLRKRLNLPRRPSLQRNPNPPRSRDQRANPKASQRNPKRSLNQEAVKSKKKPKYGI